MKLCPFRKAAAPPDFDPNDGTWLWVTASPYNAVGDGTHDDTAGIQACMTAAAAAGKGVYVPAGTYLISTDTTTVFQPPSNLAIRGAGRESSILKMAHGNRLSRKWMFYLSGVDYVTIQGLGFFTPEFDTPVEADNNDDTDYGDTGIGGIYISGDCSYGTLKDLRFDNVDSCINFSVAVTNSDHFTIEDIYSYNTIFTLFLASVEDTTINRMYSHCYFQDGSDWGQPTHWHNVYIERHVTDVVFNDCEFYGASGYNIQTWGAWYGDYECGPITFNDCTFDCTQGHGGILLSDEYSIYFNDCTFAAEGGVMPYQAIIYAYGAPTAAVFDGFTATGMTYLYAGDYSTGAGIVFRNGTYDGTALAYPGKTAGATFEGTVSLV